MTAAPASTERLYTGKAIFASDNGPQALSTRLQACSPGMPPERGPPEPSGASTAPALPSPQRTVTRRAENPRRNPCAGHQRPPRCADGRLVQIHCVV